MMRTAEGGENHFGNKLTGERDEGGFDRAQRVRARINQLSKIISLDGYLQIVIPSARQIGRVEDKRIPAAADACRAAAIQHVVW